MGFRKLTDLDGFTLVAYFGFAVALFAPVLMAWRLLDEMGGFEIVVVLLWWRLAFSLFKAVTSETDIDDDD